MPPTSWSGIVPFPGHARSRSTHRSGLWRLDEAALQSAGRHRVSEPKRQEMADLPTAADAADAPTRSETQSTGAQGSQHGHRTHDRRGDHRRRAPVIRAGGTHRGGHPRRGCGVHLGPRLRAVRGRSSRLRQVLRRRLPTPTNEGHPPTRDRPMALQGEVSAPPARVEALPRR